MERFFKRKSSLGSSDSVGSSRTSSSRQSELDEVLANLQADPGLGIRMIEYDTNIRDEVRRAYLQKGPCQPRGHSFPQSNISGLNRRFIPQWFDEFDWLEYSVSKDAAFCLYCNLFKSNFEQVGSEAFTGAGFKNWKKGRERMKVHVGPVGSVHNKAREAATNLMNQNTHIETAVSKHSEQARMAYRRCLIASIKCTKFLLRQGLSFRRNDESATSSNKGNYLELLQFLADNDEKVKEVVLENAPGNLKLVAPKIQKDIVNACAGETLDVIMSGLKDRFFSILVDEARDISVKEQMAMVLRYVDDKGHVIERFVGVQHVTDTTSSSLKDAIDLFFSSNGLSFSKLRGQGYDGASNMRGELKGLKTKILREQPCAYYVHCFAHQLQLALVAVAKKNIDIASFFTTTNSVVNHVGASCKRRDALRAQLQEELVIAFENDCLITGRGLHQETSLKRAGDTRWSSHYGTIISIISIFSSVIHVLQMIIDDNPNDSAVEANKIQREMLTFQFVFHLFLMKAILGLTNDVSQALQKKDQEIVNAMALVKSCKEKLHWMRNNGIDALVEEVSSFCDKHHIDVPNMDEAFVLPGRSRRNAPIKTNRHHYRVELFIYVIDEQLTELDDRFNEVNTELLICLACLSPNDSFVAFDKQKLLRLAQFYPQDFSDGDLLALDDQLELYIHYVSSSSDFSDFQGIGDLAKKMVETRMHQTFNYVYLLITLALVLPVATTSVERAFSVMNIIKGPLQNKMGDQWLSDSLLVYVEKDVFDCIENEAIMLRFQNMKPRRGQL
ncbi:zinc finger MYM-type protein 1-like [Prunus dulcis]|nr:zinc finger MYM-type protein 1-like [Prunus dulcis]